MAISKEVRLSIRRTCVFLRGSLFADPPTNQDEDLTEIQLNLKVSNFHLIMKNT